MGKVNVGVSLALNLDVNGVPQAHMSNALADKQDAAAFNTQVQTKLSSAALTSAAAQYAETDDVDAQIGDANDVGSITLAQGVGVYPPGGSGAGHAPIFEAGLDSGSNPVLKFSPAAWTGPGSMIPSQAYIDGESRGHRPMHLAFKDSSANPVQVCSGQVLCPMTFRHEETGFGHSNSSLQLVSNADPLVEGTVVYNTSATRRVYWIGFSAFISNPSSYIAQSSVIFVRYNDLVDPDDGFAHAQMPNMDNIPHLVHMDGATSTIRAYKQVECQFFVAIDPGDGFIIYFRTEGTASVTFQGTAGVEHEKQQLWIQEIH